jgi:predicted nucleic acid-binding protein
VRTCELVVLDTNVVVAGGLRPCSASARLLEQVRDGELRMCWNDATRGEIERLVRRIPPLSSADVELLFREEDRCDAETHPERFAMVVDPEDRKFAALAEVCGAVLVTSDHHLLDVRDQLPIRVATPGEFSG